MKIKLTIALLCFFLIGCGNIAPRDNFNPSPQLKQDINNQQGRIDRLENNQNVIKAQIEKMALIYKENNNSGVQILQGDGGLVLIFGLTTVFMILFYFHRVAEGYRKTAEILAAEIAAADDENLSQKILKAAQHTEVESKIKKLIVK